MSTSASASTKNGNNKTVAMSRRLALVAGTAGIGAGLAGCYESPEMKVHKPGEYLGASDTQVPAAERSEMLAKRFREGQHDR